MKTVTNLAALLMHQIQNLYAAEEQQMQAIPTIIKTAHHRSLKNALKHHLELSAEQKKRLKTIAISLGTTYSLKEAINTTENKFFEESYVSKGMLGLLEEANDLLNSELASDVTDAAIIACIQKIEHYEICTYGTAHAYAVQLKEHKIEKLLKESLDEEYDADDLLTALATASLNKEAIPEGLEKATSQEEQSSEEPLYTGIPSHKAGSSERTINSPGGRAGTSHRRYPNGESRGH